MNALASTLLLGLLAGGALTTGALAAGVPTAGDESPEGSWAPTLAECRDPAGPTRFTIHLEAGSEGLLAGPQRQCRIARVTDTAIGYRLHMTCYGSADDLGAERGGRPEQAVVDAIGPVTMRADRRRVYRCKNPPVAQSVAPALLPATPSTTAVNVATAPAAAPTPSPEQPARLAVASAAGPLGFVQLVPEMPAAPVVPSTFAAPIALEPARSSERAEGAPHRGVLVDYRGGQEPGTIVVDTRARLLYLVDAGERALRYRVAVGKPGAVWTGIQRVTDKRKWPDWTPTPSMRRSRRGLPDHVAGGPRSPLGARALYLGSTMYRIHGTTDPGSIGRAASSGCIRMLNEDVIDLYERVPVGTRVVVL